MLKDAFVNNRFQIGTGAKIVLMVLLGVLFVSIIMLACVPPVSKDALTHHLAIPKLYLKQGGIYEIPWAKWSYNPMNLDLLYLHKLAAALNHLGGLSKRRKWK